MNKGLLLSWTANSQTGISAFYEIGSLGLAEQLPINLNVLWVLIVILPILWNGC